MLEAITNAMQLCLSSRHLPLSRISALELFGYTSIAY